MARVGIVFGLLLCGVTVVGLVGTLLKSPTQFYPMMLGIPVLFCGVVGLNPHRRKHAMHVASAIALAGALVGGGYAALGLVEMASGQTVDRYALSLVAAMAIICAAFFVICGISFLRNRRKESSAPSFPNQAPQAHPVVRGAPVPEVPINDVSVADVPVPDLTVRETV